MNKLQLLINVLLISAASAFLPLQSQNFTNIAPQQSIINYAGGLYGSGVSFYDWNHDGYDDISLLEQSSKPKFYINQQGNYIATSFPGLLVPADYKSINWVDFDNDGDEDISLNADGAPFKLFSNNGDFTFTDISATCGIIQVSTVGYGTSWGDYNKDGFLDVYLSTYMDSFQVNPQTNFLFKNNGDGTFENTTDIAGVSNGGQLTFESVWIDYDNDTWPDLFVANDRSFRNYLYHNNGDGTFSEVGYTAGIDQVFDAMSVTVGDYDNDGWFDMYITNTPELGNYMYHNNGDGTFSIVSASSNTQMFQYSWGAIWMDGDNDQWQDLFVATIDFAPNNFPGIDSYFRNTGTSFEPTYTTGLTTIANLSYAAARGDVNNDGYPDILLHNKQPIGTQVWKNEGGSANYLKVRLQGSISNRNGVGCRIELSAGGNHQYRYTMSGEQYLSQNSQWQFFGLSDLNQIDSLVVNWPSGHQDVFYNLPVNQSLVIVEGSSNINQIQIIGSSHICEGDSLILDAGEWDSYLWSTGSTDRYLTVYNSGTYSVEVSGGVFPVITQPIEVLINPLPIVLVESIEPPCYDSDHGYIQVTNSGVNETSQVIWTDGFEGEIRDGLSAGEYEYVLTDVAGCSFSQTIELDQPDSIRTYAEFNQTTCPNAWSGFVVAEGGTVPYQYQWDFFYEGETIPFQSLDDKAFTCIQSPMNIHAKYQITDMHGCTKMGTQILPGIVGMADLEANLETFYPNPVQQILHLNLKSAIQKLDLFDLSGRLIQTFALTESKTQEIDLSNLVSGFYLLSYKQGDEPVVKRFVKE